MNLPNDREGRDILEALADDAATARLRRERTAGQLGGDMTIEALPTVYCGTTFRSALEASWAATLDSLEIAWEYEPETVTLPSGARYIPDFRLPEIGTWLEVKGTGVPRVEKAFEFGKSLVCSCPVVGNIRRCTCRWVGGELVLIGHPPIAIDPWTDEDYDHWPAHSKRRLAWYHGGFPNWSSTRGYASWLTRCPECRKHCWFDSARCRACRGPLVGAHGARPGDRDYQFHRITGIRADDTADQDPAA